MYWHDGLSERKQTPLMPHDITYYREGPMTLVSEIRHGVTMLPYHFESVKKRNNTCVFIVKEKTLNYFKFIQHE